MKNNASAIDLFAGAGGLSVGLTAAGFGVLYANEIKRPYANTYSYNHKKSWVDQRDIRKVDAKLIRKKLGLCKGELDLLSGGPPCQGYSINAPKRSSDDERNHLFIEYLRFAREFEPKTILIENVPGLVSFEGGMTLQAIMDSLREIGYSTDVKILYAPYYGIPQTRWRTIIIGIRGDYDVDLAFPRPVYHAPVRVNFTSRFAGKNIVSLPVDIKLHKYVTVKDALDDLPTLLNGERGETCKPYRTESQNNYQRLLRVNSSGVFNHEAPNLSKMNLKRLDYIPQHGNWTNIPYRLLPKGMKKARKSDHTKRYGRSNPDGLSSTILTKCDPHWGAFFHYSQKRTFTVREAARIQSFPDNFIFTGSKSEQYEQVGNAVPPLLATAIGSSLMEILSTMKQSSKIKVG